MKISCCALLLIALVVGLQGQEPVITADTPVDSAMLQQWLHSRDPRLIAWAADFARRSHDADLLAEMPKLLEDWPASSDFGTSETESVQHRALLAVLDALVQENFQVPVHTIETIAPSFPAQAAILLARHPLTESGRTLDDWYLETTGKVWNARTLARIAAMMLAKDPKSSTTFLDSTRVSFVAGVLAASENQLQISIIAKSGVGAGYGGAACGDSFGHRLTPGWPEVYFYDLEEHSDQTQGNEGEGTHVLVELDGDRIVSRRLRENGGWGSCSAVEPLNASTRHRLIAYWLGVHDCDMTWHPVDTFTIVWTNEAAYKTQLAGIIESQRRKLRHTVEQLRQRDFLTEDEARTISPKMVLTIQCDIDPCPLANFDRDR